MFDEEIVAVDRATQIVIHTQSGFKTFEGCVEDVIDYGEQAVEAYKQSLIEEIKCKKCDGKGWYSDKNIPEIPQIACQECDSSGMKEMTLAKFKTLIKGDSTKEEK